MISEICQRIQQVSPNFPLSDTPWALLKSMYEIEDCKLPPRNVTAVGDAQVYAHNSVEIQPYALFKGLVILDEGVRIGPYSLIRGPLYIGKNSMIGPHCEVIRTLIMDESVLAHKNIVADSIIGSNVHLAGFTSTCNYAMGRDFIKIRWNKKTHKYQGKFGATIEDNTKIGSYAVVMPGCHISRDTIIEGQCSVYSEGSVKPWTK